MYGDSDQSQSKKSILKALLEFQKNISPIIKSESNPFFKSKYADINQILELILPPLHEQGILLLQLPVHNVRDDCVSIKSVLYHVESEEHLSCLAEAPLLKKDPQAVGSAYTYLRRYSIQSFLGLQAVDDDGERAMNRPTFVSPVTIKQYIDDKGVEPHIIKSMVRKHFKPKTSATELTEEQWKQLRKRVEDEIRSPETK